MRPGKGPVQLTRLGFFILDFLDAFLWLLDAFVVDFGVTCENELLLDAASSSNDAFCDAVCFGFDFGLGVTGEDELLLRDALCDVVALVLVLALGVAYEDEGDDVVDRAAGRLSTGMAVTVTATLLPKCKT